MKRFIIFCFFCFFVNTNAEPLRDIPVELIDDYTLKGKIPVEYWYLDESYSSPIFYSKNQVSDFITSVAKGNTGYYGSTDFYLYQAIKDHLSHLQGKKVAIMGSTVPWYESIVLFFEGIPVTIEYNKIDTDDSRLTLLTVSEHNKNPEQYDAIFSISSYEHDGLGRYGDPLDPNGDLRAMEETKKWLRPGGLLFLAVPIGSDILVWNTHRIYGRIRLPMLLNGWKIEKSYGFIETTLENRDIQGCYQPIFVLSVKE